MGKEKRETKKKESFSQHDEKTKEGGKDEHTQSENKRD